MGLETASFISGLTETWPTATETKSQGDDHLRLIKGVLKGTFPTASKAFYFPTAEATSGTLNLDSTDQNNMVEVTTTGGNVTVNLPSLVPGDKGWSCQVMKVTNDANAAIVAPPSGTISSKVGTTATVRVGILNEPATFFWDGATWYCFKWGPMIGSTENYNGSSVPPGYLAEDGTTYSNTTFAELFAVLASTTLYDKRGRTEIGDGTGSGLTARVKGTTYGAESVALAANQIPSLSGITGSNSITVNSGSAGGSGSDVIRATAAPGEAVGNPGSPTAAAFTLGTTVTRGALVSTNPTQTITVAYTNASQQNVSVLMPSIGVKKIIRAC